MKVRKMLPWISDDTDTQDRGFSGVSHRLWQNVVNNGSR